MTISKKKRERIVLSICMLFALLLMYIVLFFPNRMGAADNGDFYRMADRVGIVGILNFLSDDPNAFWVTLKEEWPWHPMNWKMFLPEGIAFSNGILVTLIRGITNIFSNTTEQLFSTVYLAIAYLSILLISWYWIFKYFWRMLGKAFPLFYVLSLIMLFGSMHLAWLNSFYGEASMYVGLVLCIGCTLETISVPRGSLRGYLMAFFSSLCVYFFVLSKPQNTLGFLVWGGIPVCLVTFHMNLKQTAFYKKTLWQRIASIGCMVIVVFNVIWTGVCCVAFYRWNSEMVEEDTLYHAVTLGALTLADNPEEMCKELGVDPILAQDIGKHAYLDKSEYVTAPRTPEAEERLYSKTNTFGLLKYYIMHPGYLLQALEITAQNAVHPATSLHVLQGELSAGKSRWALWANIRKYCVPHHFWQYVIWYIVQFSMCTLYLFRDRGNPAKSLPVVLYVCVMITGILQYPLPFIGNGYADTNKQLYLFMLSYDITILISVVYLIMRVQYWLIKRRG